MEIIIPQNESRIFSGEELENKVKFINVQDKNLDRTHVMVSVNVGSISDPVEYQGLAHFLEHMLFLGSEKYPGENQFEKFLNENGGSSNAYTDTFETVYYFSVFNDKLEKSIDMFSRFFIDPLFDEDSVNREINAIQSEHDKNIQQDSWRMHHFFGMLSKKESMINKFGTGNLESLKKDGVRERMINFYKEHYISSKINVVTVSSLDNSTVKEYIEKSFSNIPTNIKDKIQIEKPFFEKKGKEYFLKSISKDNNIIYLWEIPDHVTNYLTSHSPHIISHVISSDNDKSLKQILIKKGLIKGLYSYVADEGLFYLSIKLSNFENWRDVDSYVRFYINNLKKYNWQEIVEYYKKKDELIFNYSSKDDSNDLGIKLATNLIYYPIEKSYIGPNVIETIQISEITSLLSDYLRFENVNVILTSNKDSTELGDNITVFEKETEPYYDLEFNKIKLTFKDEIPETYEIIVQNPFLDTKPEWIDNLDDDILPRKISATSSTKVWFGNVSKFRETRIYSELIFTNPEFINDTENLLDTLILLDYIAKKIQNEFNLPSEIGFYTGLGIDVTNSIVTIGITGHNDNYQKYFNSVIDYIKNFKYNDDDKVMLDVIIRTVKDTHINIRKNNQWTYNSYLESINVNEKAPSIDKALEYLDTVTSENFHSKINEVKNRILYQSKFTVFIYGNTTSSELFDSDNNIVINFPSIEKPRNVLKLIPNIDCVHPNKDEKDNYVQFTHYIGQFNPKNNLLLIVLSVAMGQSFYDDLRTKQQFGYLVSSRTSKSQKNYYFKQSVQSSKSIEKIETAIQKFNDNFLSTVSEDDYKKYVDVAKKILEERENNTRELFSKYLNEIVENTCEFQRKELLLSKIKTIDYSQFKEFYQKNILNGTTSKTYIRSQE